MRGDTYTMAIAAWSYCKPIPLDGLDRLTRDERRTVAMAMQRAFVAGFAAARKHETSQHA